MEEDAKAVTVAAMLEALAYAIEEGEAKDVPSCLRMLAEELRR